MRKILELFEINWITDKLSQKHRIMNVVKGNIDLGISYPKYLLLLTFYLP